MGTILKYLCITAIAVVMLLLPACDSDGCEGNQSSLPLAGFYSSQTQTAVTIDSITVYGIGVIPDSAIIRNTMAGQVYLPFNLADSVSRFVLRYEQAHLASAGITDTLTFAYERIPYFYSPECGAMYYFDITAYDVTHALIDSISIPSLRIDNTNQENIRIYFRTETEEVEP